jgi:hypothetical protein
MDTGVYRRPTFINYLPMEGERRRRNVVKET